MVFGRATDGERNVEQFFSLYSHDFLRIGACVPRAQVAAPDFAVAETLHLAGRGSDDGCAVMLFPELGLSSYAIDEIGGGKVGHGSGGIVQPRAE
ncbi:hypothetical protein EV561_15418 [Rhizobium sp. BK376]|nr:hypothetical protein EV561_15418 [Rhizobium sp. BK376]